MEVVNARFCKPLDEEFVVDLCNRHDCVVTLEDHVTVGGFGSAVLECVAANAPVRAQVQVMGVPDEKKDLEAQLQQALRQLRLGEDGVLDGARQLAGGGDGPLEHGGGAHVQRVARVRQQQQVDHVRV